MKEYYSKKYRRFDKNLLIEWTCPHGPEKGQRIQAWFSIFFEEPEIKNLIDNYEGKIIETCPFI